MLLTIVLSTEPSVSNISLIPLLPVSLAYGENVCALLPVPVKPIVVGLEAAALLKVVASLNVLAST